jgi:hypothetical protein
MNSKEYENMSSATIFCTISPFAWTERETLLETLNSRSPGPPVSQAGLPTARMRRSVGCIFYSVNSLRLHNQVSTSVGIVNKLAQIYRNFSQSLQTNSIKVLLVRPEQLFAAVFAVIGHLFYRSGLRGNLRH